MDFTIHAEDKTLYYIIGIPTRKGISKNSINSKKQLTIMEMNYVAPELEVLEVMVEKGFEGSVAGPGFENDGTGGVELP